MKITAAQRKLFASLSSARSRREEGLFLAEGARCLRELSPVFNLRFLVVTSQWVDSHADELEAITGGKLPDERLVVAKNDELARISTMMAPQGVIGVFELPETTGDIPEITSEDLVLALDRIQDPGNLGTIIRAADWFGVKTVLASRETVDVFNPKVLQSTMGALARVRVCYCDLPQTLSALSRGGAGIYGTFLDGENIYHSTLRSGVIVMGNEGNGISPEVEAVVTRRLTIPSFPPGRDTVESLNVGTAAAVVLSQLRHNSMVSDIPLVDKLAN